MAIMDKITDKPDWDKKVFDDTIVQKWRQEALATESVDVSEKMLDYVGTTFLWNTALTERWYATLICISCSKELRSSLKPSKQKLLPFLLLRLCLR